MSTWKVIVDKAFSGNPGILNGHPDTIEYDGSPNGAASGKVGTLCWDYTNSNVYINTDGGTTWIVMNA